MSVQNKPVPFGYKIAWLLFRSNDTDLVVDALHLRDTQPVDWQTGISAAYAGQVVYVSPPLRGWVFAVGMPLFGASMDADRSMEPFKESLRKLSATFEEIQAFASHRVTEYHHWVIVRNGNISRSFAFCGEVGELWDDEGTKIADESSFVMDPESEEYNPPDETSVMQVAGAYGIDPQSLEFEPPSNRLGVLGSVEMIGSSLCI